MRNLVVVVALLVAVGCGGGGGGGDWVEQDVPVPGALTAYTVWVAGDDDVWLGGSSAWHFDGSGWTERALPGAPAGVVDFWGFSPTDVWAISDSRAFRWDGTAWTEVPATAGVGLTAMWRIWGTSDTDIWVGNQDNSRVYHYDGATWTVTTLQFVMATALWGSSAQDIWLAGITDLYHYDGTTWTRDDSTTSPHGGYGIWGFGPSDVWAVGGFDALSHWDGAAWTPDDGDHESYNGVWGSAPDDVYAVGDRGAVAHFDGAAWSTSRGLPQGQNFTMVHGSSATNVWATAVDLGAPRALVLRYQP